LISLALLAALIIGANRDTVRSVHATWSHALQPSTRTRAI